MNVSEAKATDRKDLTGPALRTFFRIAEAWGLREQEQMRLLGGPRIDDPRARWWYLTTASVSHLLPLLDGFGQDVSVEHDDQGRPTRTLNHLLKLFTVDSSRQVREIYSVATLAPEAIINDLRTLMLDPAGG